ncbi:hypothetical protein [Raoultella ornithinolytica]|uniref:hypothetical protein n=1 Tax=Raoultella ornithinolytica TaxID=54291 RepID=UPI001F378B36|nr:hypothetical protein [Raoultella ornithinolytica]
MIAKSQLIDETTVRRHLNDWLNEEKLKPENGGTQSHLSCRNFWNNVFLCVFLVQHSIVKAFSRVTMRLAGTSGTCVAD